MIKSTIICLLMGAMVTSPLSFAEDSNDLRIKLNKSAEKIDWSPSSEGREFFKIETDTGDVLTVLDVDGVGYIGDMILGETEKLKQYGLKFNGASTDEMSTRGHTIIPTSGLKWPNGVVPYSLASNLGATQRRDVINAIAHWHEKTNIRFVQRTNQTDYVYVVNGGGCSSYIGKVGGSQSVTLAAGCGFGAAVHELGHAVGLYHEQNRSDRDNYVAINWGNIQSGMSFNFQKTPSRDGVDHGIYDYNSIMHYGAYGFSNNGSPTITTHNGATIGQTNGLSAGDIAAVASIYGGTTTPTPKPGESYKGYLYNNGDSNVQPDGSWFNYQGGQLVATLVGPVNTDFELKLYKWHNGQWAEVAKSTSPSSNESITYNASAGYYKFDVYSYSGYGWYTFTLSK